MASRLLGISDRLCRILLQAYPAAFRERFAAEMAQVFRSLCSEAYLQSGAGGVIRLWLSAIWDWLWSAMVQWWNSLFKQRAEIMQTNLPEHRGPIEPLSAAQAGLAVLPFLAFGISSIVSRLEFFQTGLASLPLWQILLIHPFLACNWLILIGLGAGILAGFPRWAYSFLGWALLFAGLWMNMKFYGYTLDGKIWLPLLGVFLLALLVRRSLQPLRALFAGLWVDLTLPSLGIYILYGFMYMLFDEHPPYLLAFIALTTLAISLGAWGYFRSIFPLRRVLALAGGLFLATVISLISYTTWDSRAYYRLPESSQNGYLVGLIFFIVLALLMFGNGLLARWRLMRLSRQ